MSGARIPLPPDAPPHRVSSAMSKTYNFIMKVYLVFVAAKALAKFSNFYLPGSKEHFYFQVVSAFNPYFFLDYTANAVQVVLNLWQVVPVYYYIYGHRPDNIVLWRLLFITKMVFDVIGNSYAYVIFRTAYHDGGWNYVAIYVALSILIYIPSTLIWFLQAFQGEYIYAFRDTTAKAR